MAIVSTRGNEQEGLFCPICPHLTHFLYFCQEIDHSPIFSATQLKVDFSNVKIHEKSIDDINFELLEIAASDRFHDKRIKNGLNGANKSSCSFPRVETIANRFLVIFYLRKISFGRPKTPATISSVFWLDFALCALYGNSLSAILGS